MYKRVVVQMTDRSTSSIGLLDREVFRAGITKMSKLRLIPTPDCLIELPGFS